MGMPVAVKVNSGLNPVQCRNEAAIDNGRQLLELLLQGHHHPDENIRVDSGIVTDAPDGTVRLRMVIEYCHSGTLDGYPSLNGVRRQSGEVCH